jgi:hypothetical protein
MLMDVTLTGARAWPVPFLLLCDGQRSEVRSGYIPLFADFLAGTRFAVVFAGFVACW